MPSNYGGEAETLMGSRHPPPLLEMVKLRNVRFITLQCSFHQIPTTFLFPSLFLLQSLTWSWSFLYNSLSLFRLLGLLCFLYRYVFFKHLSSPTASLLLLLLVFYFCSRRHYQSRRRFLRPVQFSFFFGLDLRTIRVCDRGFLCF